MSASDQASISYGSGPWDTCPVFRPSMEDFEDFEGYMLYVERACVALDHGLCKVVAPAEWRKRLEPIYANDAFQKLGIVIDKPIRQHSMGRGGTYQQVHMMERKIDVSKFRKLTSVQVRAGARTHGRDRFRGYQPSDVERSYWRNIGFSRPLYGSDIPMSIMEHSGVADTTWNLNRLATLLTRRVAGDIPGVTRSYIYFGSWKSTFAWHVEDMDLLSINYHHFGSPKQWYALPASKADAFESVAASLFPAQANSCKHFLRHKTTVISPQVLAKHNIIVDRVLQRPGEFVVSLPRAYHAGFNHGFNCNEAVNFASARWIAFGHQATRCTCQSGAVDISMAHFADDEISTVSRMEGAGGTGSVEAAREWDTGEDVEDMDHPVYIAIENESPAVVSRKLGLLGAREVVRLNAARLPGLRQNSKLLDGTVLILPEGVLDTDRILTGPGDVVVVERSCRPCPGEARRGGEKPEPPPWVFSCCCGLHEGITSTDHVSKHPLGEQFSCDSCGRWCHVHCFARYRQLTMLPDSMFCHRCVPVDAIEPPRNKGKQEECSGPKQPSCKSESSNKCKLALRHAHGSEMKSRSIIRAKARARLGRLIKNLMPSTETSSHLDVLFT